ncbi:MAG TPA: bifunctional hydroxymethylpyrimidine kinase/phosphomethylpyrimidine kinase [Anaerolineae bacterium]|nr:bifunctional hydroxymethylpyrimidine kinase/phosphomethylpyrimidine kinase [Anaerolineae bacterium]
MIPPPKTLTIAGSDSGGAAGLQADLKTFTALQTYGLSVITVATAQNSQTITALHPLPPTFVAQQLTTVLSDYAPPAIKTGFLGSADLIHTLTPCLADYQPQYLIIDPVLVNHKGESMFPPEVAEAYQKQLFPLATLITPNRAEATLFTNLPITNWDEGQTAVRALHQLGAPAVLLKGVPDGNHLVDLFYDGTMLGGWRTPRHDTTNTHGSGDTLSAAILAYLAHGQPLNQAVGDAHYFTQQAIYHARDWQLGAGHGPLNQMWELPAPIL